MPPADLNANGGEEQESVCPVKDLELLAAGTKHLLVTGAKELLETVQSSSLLPAPWTRRCLPGRRMRRFHLWIRTPLVGKRAPWRT